MSRIEDLSDDARVWIYQSKTPIPVEHHESVQEAINNFAESWASHGSDVQAAGKLIDGHFVVLAADEKVQGVSGCSIDSSVKFIKNLQEQLNIDLFDRMAIPFESENELNWTSVSSLTEDHEKGKIQDDTIVYDHLVKSLGEWRRSWKRPLHQSWAQRIL